MKMKKFLNAPENITQELLEGMAAAYPHKIRLADGKIMVRAEAKSEDKVAVITLGGAGHEPALSGFVGYGMLDASVAGDIFAAPNAVSVLAALRKFKRDAGILLVVLNHAGDVMSANMAMKMAEREGIKVKSILTCDDISAGLDSPLSDRRGLAGCLPIIKVAGAAAEEGKNIDEVFAIADKFSKRVATLAVAMGGCTHPQNGLTITELADDEMEIGMGQHGEGGGGKSKILSADETAKIMFAHLAKTISLKAGDRIFAIMNGVGATTPMELCLVFRAVKNAASEIGVEVVGGLVDELLTVQEMSGFQMILCALDDVSEKYLYAKSNAPYWTSIGK